LPSGFGLTSSETTLVSSRKPLTAQSLSRNRVVDPVESPNRPVVNLRRTGPGSHAAFWTWKGARTPRPAAPPQPFSRAWSRVAGRIPGRDGRLR
jgi:hypothetical protein